MKYSPEYIQDEFDAFFSTYLPYRDKLEYLDNCLDMYGPNVVVPEECTNEAPCSYPIFYTFIDELLIKITSSKKKREIRIKAIEAFLKHPDFEIGILNFSTGRIPPPIYSVVNRAIRMFINRDKKNIPDDILDLIDLMLEKGANPFKKYERESVASEVNGILQVQGVAELPNSHRVPIESLERLKKAFDRFYEKEYGTPGAPNKRNQNKRFTLKNKRNRNNDPNTTMYNRNKALTENLKGNYNRSRNSALNRNLGNDPRKN